MDLSALDLGPTSQTARDRSPGHDVLEGDDGRFAETLLEMAELRDADSYDDVEDRWDDSDTPSEDAEADSDTAPNDTESAPGGSEKAAGDPLALAMAASPTQSGETSAATLLTQITPGAAATAGQTAAAASTAGQTAAAASTGEPAKAGPAGRGTETVVAAGQMTAQASTAAALQGEARVLAKRSDTIAANDKHAQSVKAELTGKAGEAGTNNGANGQAAKGDGAPVTAAAGRETIQPNSEIARLDQALRQAFPAASGETGGAASTNAAANSLPRPGGETLLVQRGADQSVESGSHLTGTGERPTPVATAKAAAARPAFNLPAGRPAEQVSVQIQNGLRNGSDRIQIKLTPASLGTVEVKLELGPDKTVQAMVSADKPETLDMLERDARVLQKALEEAGLRTNSDSLSFSQRDSGNSANAQGEGDSRTASGEAGDADADSSAENTDTQIETQARRSHDGLIDIEA